MIVNKQKFLSSEQKTMRELFIAGLLVWMVVQFAGGYKQNYLSLYTQIVICIVPLFAGAVGWFRSWQWGGFRSQLGKAMGLCSTGLFLFGVAWSMWLYQDYVIGAWATQPLLADYVMMWSLILWMVGLYYLGQIIGIRTVVKSWKGKVAFVFLTALTLGLGYCVQVGFTGKTLMMILTASNHTVVNGFYNFGGLLIAVMVTVLYILSGRYLGGRYKGGLLYLFLGLLLQYAATVLYLRDLRDGTYFSGNVTDLFYTVALFLEGFGIIRLDPRKKGDGSNFG